MFADADLRLHSDPTPRKFRALTLSALEPEKGGLIWDVGAGSGSVALEWIAARLGNKAIAIELEAKYVAMIRENAKLLSRLGRDPSDLDLIHADASAMVGHDRAPDAIFLGCPSQVTAETVEALYQRLPVGGRFVCNAIQKSSVDQIMRLLRNHPRDGAVLVIELATIKGDGSGTRCMTRHQLTLTRQ